MPSRSSIEHKKIVVHPVPDESCSFFLIVQDYSLDDDPELPELEKDEEEAKVRVEDRDRRSPSSASMKGLSSSARSLPRSLTMRLTNCMSTQDR